VVVASRRDGAAVTMVVSHDRLDRIATHPQRIMYRELVQG
jgi:hypothetical protein